MTLYSLVAALMIINFGTDRIKTVGASVSKFPAHMVGKFQSPIKLFNFWQITKNAIAYIAS